MSSTTTSKPSDLLLLTPAFFGFGNAFYLTFSTNFLTHFLAFTLLFLAGIFLYLFERRETRKSLMVASCCWFLLGSFYANFYEKIFLNQKEINGKIFVNAVGKIEEIKEFYNPINHSTGFNLLIAKPILYKIENSKNDKLLKKKLVKKPKKKRAKKKTKAVLSLENKERKAEEKKRKKILKEQKRIEENFLNLAGWQEIDRQFLDYSKNYQAVEWRFERGRDIFPNPPQKISVIIFGNKNQFSVNDVIAAKLMLQPPQRKEFPQDFDFLLDAKSKKIGAYGFVIGETKTVAKAQISSLDEWFGFLREKISQKILTTLPNDCGAIALAFLTGKQNAISSDLLNKIRLSGLTHLLSISGFHLSLAAAIFFVGSRYFLARSEYLALNFDLKKFAAIFAICATYFYLKIAASPLPAQRAFLMVLFLLVALFVSEKLNLLRAIMSAVLLIILINPYAVFNISFQLSFASILALASFHQATLPWFRKFLPQPFLRYFIEIILASIFLQIATLPFLMHSFQNVALLGFVANLLAIPLTSFFIMPLGFLSLFLMPLGFEKYALLLMGEGIFYLEKIINFTTSLSYSSLANPYLPTLGLILAIVGLLIFCLLQGRFKILGATIFLLSFTTIFFTKKPDILFDNSQKFFALFDQTNGLIFSKDLKPSKQRKLWMDNMRESEFKSLKTHPQKDVLCDEKKCLIYKNEKKILVLLKREKIAQICQNDFDVIVNLSAKYQLPDCVGKEKIRIDNFDFYERGGQFFYLQNGELKIKNSEENFW